MLYTSNTFVHTHTLILVMVGIIHVYKHTYAEIHDRYTHTHTYTYTRVTHAHTHTHTHTRINIEKWIEHREWSRIDIHNISVYKNVYRIYAREFSKRGNVRARVRKTGPVLAF